MSMLNPLAESGRTDADDRVLVARAQAGDRQALEELVGRHQGWIYNIAIRMLAHPQDAEDATQEILIKALTRLTSFEGRSSFRTWLYRLVINHVLNTRRGRAEPATTGFECYAHGLDTTPDLDLPDPRSVPADLRLLVDEARISCTSRMLLCLDREQRLLYILGEILAVTDTVGAELLEISPENFRQRLARARRDLHNFMTDKCGPVTRANPCRCAKKTRGFMQAGYVDPANLLFAKERMQQVRDVVRTRSDALATIDDQCFDSTSLYLGLAVGSFGPGPIITHHGYGAGFLAAGAGGAIGTLLAAMLWAQTGALAIAARESHQPSVQRASRDAD